MLVRIYQEQDGCPVMLDQSAVKLKKEDFRTLEACLREKCEALFGGESAEFPRLCLYQNPEGKSTFRIRKGSDKSSEGRNESIITWQTADTDEVKMSEIVYTKDGSSVTRKFGAEFLYEGFVIATGMIESGGLYGSERPTYLKSINARYIYRCGISDAKKFPTAQAALTFIRKYERQFRHLAGNCGWKPELRFCSDVYRNYIETTVTEKKKTKMIATLAEANALLADCLEHPVKSEPEPYGETPMEEALLRMKMLKIWDPVVKNFKDGKVMMSEFGGIIYDLDDGAKEAVKASEERGDLPYHVIKTGEFYSVLCVTKDRDSWKYERYDPGTKRMDVFVKNGYIEEFGPIKVDPCNGGLVRTE